MRKRLRCLVSTCITALHVAIALSVVLALGASTASAAPKGEYKVFADCPTSNPALSGCIAAHTEGGEFTIGKQTVPIKKVQTVQGGFIEETSGTLRFVGAAHNNTLSKTPQVVPGGVLGTLCGKLPLSLKTLCNSFLSKGLTAVTATTELAAPASNIGLNEGNLLSQNWTALSLPIKVKLNNAFLGTNCYIGSNSSPITLNLTTGETSPPPSNKPIKGKVGSNSIRAEGNILVISNSSLVDNSFAAPGATGCGGASSLIVDPVLNSVLGIPAAAGTNTAILNSKLEQTGVEPARKSE
jgi:hypothetical protein